MKEIGQQLKTARENMNISIEEVAEDLKVRPTQVENIEAGNSEAFDDVFYLKYFIRDYAKYLGLNKEDLVDEFNEYLFDYTSRLSLDDIKMAKEKISTNTVKSPYTKNKKRKLRFLPIFVYSVVLMLIVIIFYFIITISIDSDDFEEGAVITERK